MNNQPSNAEYLDMGAKVRRRMVEDRNPLLVTLQDKAAVKQYALERGVASPALLFLTQDPTVIPFDSLPLNCFIKANHGCGWNVLREAGEFYYFLHGDELLKPDGTLVAEAARMKFNLSRGQVIALLQRMLVTRFAAQEWAYQQIVPRILVEEKLYSADGGELRDYRFYTFNGVVRAVGVSSSSYRRNHENAFFTPDWRIIPLSIYREQLPDPLPARPAQLAEMIDAAQRIGTGIDFVRVDLYQSTRGVMLGEVTIYPGGGLPGKPTGCPHFNKWLGDFWL